MKQINKMIFQTLFVVSFVVFSNLVSAQQAKIETVQLSTSGQCGMCKERIEAALAFAPGIQFVELSMVDMALTVKYKTKKIDLQGVKKLVSDLGYSAGDMKANEDAMNKLPMCCQPGGHL